MFPQGALLGDVPVLDSPLSVNTREMGARAAATLGAGPALLLKSHGAVVVGAGVIECFALAIYLEENAYRQYLALQIGSPVRVQRGGTGGLPRPSGLAGALPEGLGPLPGETRPLEGSGF